MEELGPCYCRERETSEQQQCRAAFGAKVTYLDPLSRDNQADSNKIDSLSFVPPKQGDFVDKTEYPSAHMLSHCQSDDTYSNFLKGSPLPTRKLLISGNCDGAYRESRLEPFR